MEMLSELELKKRIVEISVQELENSRRSDGVFDGTEWDNIIFGIAGGADKAFYELKAVADYPCFTPEELFNTVHSGQKAAADELSVINWILPHSAEVVKRNSAAKGNPALIWGAAKLASEGAIMAIGKKLAEFFGEMGIVTVFPHDLAGIVKRNDSEKFYAASNWSERHASYAAGLGTFGLCDGLITPLGKAHRCGSIIVKAKLTPSRKDYKGLHDYCPYYANGSCGVCMKRCPVGAISSKGHDKRVCETFLHGDCEKNYTGIMGQTVGACGLCQTNVPCVDRIPGREKSKLYREFID